MYAMATTTIISLMLVVIWFGSLVLFGFSIRYKSAKGQVPDLNYNNGSWLEELNYFIGILAMISIALNVAGDSTRVSTFTMWFLIITTLLWYVGCWIIKKARDETPQNAYK